MNLELYKRLDRILASKKAGTTKEIAHRLGVSERQVSYMIKMMKEECDCPISYDKSTKNTIYKIPGNCQFRFEPCKKEEFMDTVMQAVSKFFD